jgi:hypothetical protein
VKKNEAKFVCFMNYKETGKAGRTSRRNPFQGEESEQYPTLRFNSPPVPAWERLVPRGLVGYEELKAKYRLEAWRDREASKADALPEIRRLAFITKLKRSMPEIDIEYIAESIDPWDMNEFKSRVADAVVEYRKAVAK